MESMSGAAMEMPKYQSHKKVWALQIKEIVPQVSEDFFAGNGPTHDGAIISPVDERYAPFQVDQAYLDKHKPEVNGYYVVYEDGYKSFSPAKAFEDGYTKI